MSVRRFYLRALPDESAVVTLDAGATRHARVLRLSPGDGVRLFDGRGREADAVVESLRERLVCRTQPAEETTEPGPHVTLIQCVPKGSKLPRLVRMVTELGVASVHLAHSARSVPRPRSDRLHAQVDRLERVAREAARQSVRARVPPVLAPVELTVAAARAPTDGWRLVLAPGGAGSSPPEGADAAWLIVGPEGGLTDPELDGLVAEGWELVSLGEPVMRVETAAAAATAVILDRLRR